MLQMSRFFFIHPCLIHQILILMKNAIRKFHCSKKQFIFELEYKKVYIKQTGIYLY